MEELKRLLFNKKREYIVINWKRKDKLNCYFENLITWQLTFKFSILWWNGKIISESLKKVEIYQSDLGDS